MIRVANIVKESYVDGPGKRTVVFLQGCTLACQGCQNRAIWPKDGGTEWDERKLAAHVAELAGPGGQVTISGGEPFQQAGRLAMLVAQLKAVYGIAHLIVYTGYTIDELMDPIHPANMWMFTIAKHVDVIVDGRYVRELDDDFLSYRGSRNQRPIDLQASIRTGELVLLDWDQPEIVITDDGDALMPLGLVLEFQAVGLPQRSRMCGQRY